MGGFHLLQIMLALLLVTTMLLTTAHAARGQCRWSWRRVGCSLSCRFGVGNVCRGSMHHVPSPTQPPSEWTMVRLFDDGERSYWGEVSFPFTSGGEIGRMTDRLPCEGVWLRWTAGSYDYKWHNAPRRQLIASLNGHVEASVDEAGRDRRRFGPGELLLAEDTRGRGHNTKSLDGVGRWSVFIALGAPGPLGWLWAPLSPREKVLLYLAAAAGLWRLGRRWRGGGGVVKVKQEGAAAKAPACA